WELQLQDVTRLQLAQTTANLNLRSAFKWAIAQAQQIEPDRPRRSQAQTLVAHWHQEIERIEDGPYLLQARQLAQSGTISSLQAAITQASQVPMGRALRAEAQGLIYAWNYQIETLEDQPLLDQAWALARQGRRNAAIRQAAKISSGRALYPKASGAISHWRREIRQVQRARERAILAANLQSKRAQQRETSNQPKTSDPTAADAFPQPTTEVSPLPINPETQPPTEISPIRDHPSPLPAENMPPAVNQSPQPVERTPIKPGSTDIPSQTIEVIEFSSPQSE
ncbi:MAG: hypothetical protein F6K19_31985, partial [Cyanothece sp. SIO1E1]|nr:hypothetical protein [Cyanothece sp. SIO1E1]